MAKKLPSDSSESGKSLEASKDATNPGSAFPSTSADDIAISASEMEELFGHWTANGKCDLKTNLALTKKMRVYLDWQSKIRVLKAELANSQFENFLVPEKSLHEDVFLDIFVNGKKLGNFCFYGMSSYFCILKFSDFRWILNYIGNELANYAFRDNEVYIDVASWVISHGGQLKPEDGAWYITIDEKSHEVN